MEENKKNIIGEVSVEVKAGLTVDKKTFRTCMNLAAIHAENQGLKGMVVYFDRDDPDGYSILPLGQMRDARRSGMPLLAEERNSV